MKWGNREGETDIQLFLVTSLLSKVCTGILKVKISYFNSHFVH